MAALEILQSPNIRIVLEVLTQLGPVPRVLHVCTLARCEIWASLSEQPGRICTWHWEATKLWAQVFECVWPKMKMTFAEWTLWSSHQAQPGLGSACPGGSVNAPLAAGDFKETILFWGMCMGTHFPLGGHYGDFGVQLHLPRLLCYLEPHLNLWKLFLGVYSIYIFNHLIFSLIPSLSEGRHNQILLFPLPDKSLWHFKPLFILQYR